MNKQLSLAEVDALMESVIPKPVVTLSRKQKLLRWAESIMDHTQKIRMLHDVEYMDSGMLSKIRITGTIYDIAAKDPVLAAAGLTANDPLSAARFFDLGREDLHFISCDCHGEVDNAEMARRVARVANFSKRPF